jgi:hypothetical protein
MIEHFITDHSQLSLIWFTYNIPNPWLFNVVKLTAVYLKSGDLISSSLSYHLMNFQKMQGKICILHLSVMLRRGLSAGPMQNVRFRIEAIQQDAYTYRIK